MENLKKHCPLCARPRRIRDILAVQKCGTLADLFPHAPQKFKKDKDYARGECALDFVQCLECGFIYNQAFDAAAAQRGYRDAAYYQQKQQGPAAQRVLAALADKILSFAGEGAVVLEIAPGHGELLQLLAPRTHFIYSIDPSPSAARFGGLNHAHFEGFFGVEFLKTRLKHRLDCVIFRHLLEHLDGPWDFLKEVVALLEDGGMIYMEMPDVEEIFAHHKFYEFFHDHFAYFQKNLLINFMSGLGCEFMEHYPLYEGAWMGLFFKKKGPAARLDLAVNFFGAEISALNKGVVRLNEILSKYENVGIYGAGIHANSFLYYLSDENVRKIEYAFDVNPEKIGRFLQNSDIEIKAPRPEILQKCDCLLMSVCLHEERVLKDEIFPMIRQGLWGGGLSSPQKIA